MTKWKRYVKDLPFALLLIDAIWWVLSFRDIYISDYWFVGEIASHSLAFTLALSFYAYLHRACLYTWLCLIGLGLLNLLNILVFFVKFNQLQIYAGLALVIIPFPLKYYQTYAGIIIITCLTFAIIKWNSRQYYRKY